MQVVDKSDLPGKNKYWSYPNEVLPSILRLVLVYDVPISTVEDIEQPLNGYIILWLGVTMSFSSIGLHNAVSKLQLPLSSITEELSVTKARQVMMLN